MGGRDAIVVRPADAIDVSAIARVHCASALAAYVDIFPAHASAPTAATLAPSWSALIDDPDATVLIAEDIADDITRRTVIIGCVAVRADATVPSGWLLTRLYVEPNHWGRRIGSRLHDRAVAAVNEQGADRMNLWVLEANQRARSMYERRGRRLVPGRLLVNDEPTVFDVLYERALNMAIEA